jgi:hypothetical protein
VTFPSLPRNSPSLSLSPAPALPSTTHPRPIFVRSNPPPSPRPSAFSSTRLSPNSSFVDDIPPSRLRSSVSLQACGYQSDVVRLCRSRRRSLLWQGVSACRLLAERGERVAVAKAMRVRAGESVARLLVSDALSGLNFLASLCSHPSCARRRDHARIACRLRLTRLARFL